MDNLTAEMMKKAKNALQNSYSPYSHFPVACCIATTDGALFTGVNVENAAYGLTICAETSAIAQMISNGQRQIAKVLVMTPNTFCPPCGACRQMLLEFSQPEMEIVLCDDKETIHHQMPMKSLLPLAFSNDFLTGSFHE